jgi:hypothetical protein
MPRIRASTAIVLGSPQGDPICCREQECMQLKPAERAEMQLHGSTEANLTAAIRSANRLRGRAIYRETVAFWAELVLHARHELSCSDASDSDSLARLVAELELEIDKRSGSPS